MGTSTREGREDSYGVGKVTLLTELLARTQRLAGKVRTHRRSIHLHPLGQLGLRGEASARWPAVVSAAWSASASPYIDIVSRDSYLVYVYHVNMNVCVFLDIKPVLTEKYRICKTQNFDDLS